MKVKCIKPDTHKDLTKDRIYEVLRDTRYSYTIKDDAGDVEEYFKNRFSVVPDAPVAAPAPTWDVATRGPQMATLTGKHILKYQMPVLEQFEMQLPQNAHIIRMEDQGGMFWLWAVVDTRAPLETRKFRAFKTGALIPDSFDGKYIGFCKIHVQMELGLYIFEEV